MSWLFSRALVEESLVGTYLDGELSEPLSGNLMPLAFLSHDKTTAFSRLSRFGVTFRPLMDDLGGELLMSFLAGFHARTYQSPEKAQASPGSDQECGHTWRGSLAKFDPVSRSWKTAQLCLLGDSELSSVTWPRSGMTAGGQCWELPMLERRTAANDSGLWPTPTCPNGGRSVAHVTDWRSERTAYTDKGKKVQVDLAQAVKRWPTPTVCGNHNRKGASATSGDGLATAVRLWATPVARDYRSPGRSRFERTGSKAGDPLPQQVGGPLNPMWVEWLMGWPLGWTDLKPLAMDKCHSAPLKHGESLQEA